VLEQPCPPGYRPNAVSSCGPDLREHAEDFENGFKASCGVPAGTLARNRAYIREEHAPEDRHTQVLPIDRKNWWTPSPYPCARAARYSAPPRIDRLHKPMPQPADHHSITTTARVVPASMRANRIIPAAIRSIPRSPALVSSITRGHMPLIMLRTRPRASSGSAEIRIASRNSQHSLHEQRQIHDHAEHAHAEHKDSHEHTTITDRENSDRRNQAGSGTSSLA